MTKEAATAFEAMIAELVEEAVDRKLATLARSPAAANGDQLPEYLTTRQVSEMLKVSVDTLEMKRATGKGPPYLRAGRRVLYERSAIAEWLKSGTL